MTADTAAPAVVTLRQVRSRGRLRGLVRLLGPAFVASVAYVDPGNVATNFAAGARFGYRLLWVVVAASVVAFGVQYLTSKAGLASGRNLPELCRERYGRRANVLLWLQAEVVVMATDLAEFVGSAVGLHLVLGIPPFPAGLITAVAAFAVLGLERRGRRRFELVVTALLMIVGLGFGYVFLRAGHQDYGLLARGLLPRVDGSGALGLTVAIVGATVMPHVVYLHSELQRDRIRAAGPAERRALLRYNRWDCVLGLGAAGVVNALMLCAGAAALRGAGGPAATGALEPVSGRLAAVGGGGVALAFGIGLMASGLSSSAVGTYAGQVVMGGFIRRAVPLLARRGLSMLPALAVLAAASDTTGVLVYSQVVLSFGIPFALIPLLLVTRDPAVMGDMVNRRATDALMTAAAAVIVGLNAWLLWTTVTGVA